jgi:hypothetical protein
VFTTRVYYSAARGEGAALPEEKTEITPEAAPPPEMATGRRTVCPSATLVGLGPTLRETLISSIASAMGPNIH